MPRRPDEVEQTLQTKFRFTLATGRDHDHRWYELRLEGLPPIRTFFSRGSKPIDEGLERAIARELHVRASYFRGMIDCDNSREDYYRQVRYFPHPPFPFYSPPDPEPSPLAQPPAIEEIPLPEELIIRAFGQSDSEARSDLHRSAKQATATAYQSRGLAVPDELELNQIAQRCVVAAEQRYYNTLS